jgi:hypothetical protein
VAGADNPRDRRFAAGTQAGGSKPKREYPKVEQVKVDRGEDRFAVTAVLARADGAVEQSIAFVSLPDGSAVYVERLTARSAVKLSRLETGTIGVLNSPEWVYQGGPRRWTWDGGQREIDGQKPADAFTIPSRWTNVDDRWGFVSLDEKSWRYVPNHQASRGRREQFLFLAPPASMDYVPDQFIAQRGVVTLLNRTSRETAALSREIVAEADGGKLTVRLPRHQISVDLTQRPPVAAIADR